MIQIKKFRSGPIQIAYGITGVKTNPDFIEILKYTKEQGIVPNFTLSGIDLDDDYLVEIVKYIGACAVSAYETNKNICYDTVKKFTDAGINQTNIHLTVMKENIDFVYEVLNDIKTDPRLAKLNAVVLLKLKPKGRATEGFNNLSNEEYNKLFQWCVDSKINFGMDSCSASSFELFINECITDENKKREYNQVIESCESFGLFSSYINVFGSYFPCSFTEGEGEWKEGLDVLNCNDFLKDIWFNEKLNKYREKSLSTCYPSGCRRCLTFNIDPK